MVLEFKAKGKTTQYTAIDEAIRTAQFVRNKCIRYWMDNTGVGQKELYRHPAAFGYTNVISACMSGSRACGNPDQFLFWDGIHPTTAAHRILGEAAFSAIQDTGMVDSRAVVLK